MTLGQSIYAVEYCTTTETKTRGDRYLTSYTFSGETGTVTITGFQSASSSVTNPEPCYFDKTSSVLTVQAGSTVTPTIDYIGYAMHVYIWLDRNNDGVFTPELAANGSVTENSELLAFTYYNGKNSKGEAAGANVRPRESNLPFVIPADLAPGNYRARIIITYGSIDPCEAQGSNGGSMVDFTILVGAPMRTLDIRAYPRGGKVSVDGTVYANVKFDAEGPVECKAIPDPGYIFVSWVTASAASKLLSTSPTYIDNTPDNHFLTAVFMPIPVTPVVPQVSTAADPTWYIMRTIKSTTAPGPGQGGFLTRKEGTFDSYADTSYVENITFEDINLFRFEGSDLNSVLIQSRDGYQLFNDAPSMSGPPLSYKESGTPFKCQQEDAGGVTGCYVFGAPASSPDFNYGYLGTTFTDKNLGGNTDLFVVGGNARSNLTSHWLVYQVFNMIVTVTEGVVGGSYGIGAVGTYWYDVVMGDNVNLVVNTSPGYKFKGWSTDGGVNIASTLPNLAMRIITHVTSKSYKTYTPIFESFTQSVSGKANTDVTVYVTMAEDGTIDANGTAVTIVKNTVTPVTATINASGELLLRSSAPIAKLDCGENTVPKGGTAKVEDLTLRNVSAPKQVLTCADGLKKVTVAVTAADKAATVCYSSAMDAGVQLVVEKEIDTPRPVSGSGTPTIFNFLSMPFDFNTSTIEYLDPVDNTTWRPASAENQIRIMTYDGQTRANGDYANTWQTVPAGGSKEIAAGSGFVLVGNNKIGGAAQGYKMKIRFTSADNAYKQVSNAEKTVTANKWRSSGGTTELQNRDWNLVGMPFLATLPNSNVSRYTIYYYSRNHSDGAADYSKNYTYFVPTDNFTFNPYEAFFMQAAPYVPGNSGDEVNVKFNPISAPMAAVKSDGMVSARVSVAVDGGVPSRLVIYDEASDNFVVNEDAWYMAPMDATQPASYFIKGGNAVAVSVQPEIGVNPLAVYTGSGTEHTISMPLMEGNLKVYLKDNVSGKEVCLNDGDYQFTAAAKTTVTNRFAVRGETVLNGIGQVTASGSVYFYPTADGIMLCGIDAGDVITVYGADGAIVYNGVAADTAAEVKLPGNGIFIARIGDKSVKIIK